MPSNINPTLAPTKSLDNFRFWCQKVLPLVYDDSLSYYEVLGKMVVQLNDVIDNINADTENVLTLKDAFDDLQEYVDNFFDDVEHLADYAERAEAAQTAANSSAINAASSAVNASISSQAAMDARAAAQTAAQDATASKNDAITAATTATTKAGEAAQSAINAQTAQAGASQSATLADAARSAAQTAAQTATDEADEASASASAAATSEQNVQTLVSGLPSDFTELNTDVNNIKNSIYEQLKLSTYAGTINSTTGAITTQNAERLETYTDFVKVNPNDIIDIEVFNPNNNQIFVGIVERDNTLAFVRRYDIFTYTPSWNTNSYAKKTYTVPSGVYAIAFTQRTYGTQTFIYTRKTVNISENLVSTNNKAIINNDNVIKPFSDVYSINHQGWHECPEETAIAYKQSAIHGFKYVECDVRLTSDNVPVLLHDTTINRTARNVDGTEISETITINSITYEQALTYDFGIYKGTQYAGTKILSLFDFLTLCRNLGLTPYIELESADSNYITTIANVIKTTAIKDSIVFVSNYVGALFQMQDYFPYNRYGVSPFTYTNQFVIQANVLKNGKAEIFFNVDRTQLTDSIIDNLKEKGYPLETWLTDTEYNITSANEYITGFTSNTIIASNILKNSELN